MDARKTNDAHTELLIKTLSGQIALVELVCGLIAAVTGRTGEDILQEYHEARKEHREAIVGALYAEFGSFNIGSLDQNKKEDGNEQENTGPKAED